MGFILRTSICRGFYDSILNAHFDFIYDVRKVVEKDSDFQYK